MQRAAQGGLMIVGAGLTLKDAVTCKCHEKYINWRDPPPLGVADPLAGRANAYPAPITEMRSIDLFFMLGIFNLLTCPSWSQVRFSSGNIYIVLEGFGILFFHVPQVFLWNMMFRVVANPIQAEM